MSQKRFGVKEIDLIGASGTPTIESASNLNILLGSGGKVGIATTNPTTTLEILGDITATKYHGNTLKSRVVKFGSTDNLPTNGTENISITGFKSYGLMQVGLSTAAWIRLYTDSTSRTNDASRSVGEDPPAGSGVIAEVVTTGISTTQTISPFVIGGNMDSTPSTTIYAAVTNQSGTTQAISVNLTLLQLEG